MKDPMVITDHKKLSAVKKATIILHYAAQPYNRCELSSRPELLAPLKARFESACKVMISDDTFLRALNNLGAAGRLPCKEREPATDINRDNHSKKTFIPNERQTRLIHFAHQNVHLFGGNHVDIVCATPGFAEFASLYNATTKEGVSIYDLHFECKSLRKKRHVTIDGYPKFPSPETRPNKSAHICKEVITKHSMVVGA